MKPYKDPDEFIKALGADAFQERIDNAENSFMYEISVLEKKYDRNDPESYTSFLKEVASKLVQFRAKLERENYMRAVCDRFSIEPDGMYEMVASLGSREGIIRHERTVSPASERQAKQKKQKDSGIRKAEKILLTWLIDEPEVFDRVKEYILPEDFIDPLLKDVAEKLYAQFEKGSISPAAIVGTYDTEEAHSEVSALFNEQLDSSLSKAERERALNDVVLLVKKNSINYAIQHTSDPRKMQELTQQQIKFSNIHIEL
jgi:DNA primase